MRKRKRKQGGGAYYGQTWRDRIERPGTSQPMLARMTCAWSASSQLPFVMCQRRKDQTEEKRRERGWKRERGRVTFVAMKVEVGKEYQLCETRGSK